MLRLLPKPRNMRTLTVVMFAVRLRHDTQDLYIW